MKSAIKYLLIALIGLQMVPSAAMQNSISFERVKNVAARLSRRQIYAGVGIAAALTISGYMLWRQRSQTMPIPAALPQRPVQQQSQAMQSQPSQSPVQSHVASIDSQVTVQQQSQSAQQPSAVSGQAPQAGEVDVDTYLWQQNEEAEQKGAAAAQDSMSPSSAFVQVEKEFHQADINPCCEAADLAIKNNDWMSILINAEKNWLFTFEQAATKGLLNGDQTALHEALKQKLADSPWKKGAQHIHDINNNRPVNTTREAIREVVWFLYSTCPDVQQFQQGSFIVEDPGQRLFTWLRQPTMQSYARISSHLAEYQLDTHYGIDLDEQLGLLPNDQATVLFCSFKHAKNNNDCIFIKPEDHGVGFNLHGLWHALGYVFSVIRRNQAGANDQDSMCKERVPDNVIQLFKQIVNASNAQDVAARRIQEGKTWGIWKMREIVEQLKGENRDNDKLSPETLKAFDDACMANQPNPEHLAIAKGREVVRTQKELIEAAKQLIPAAAAAAAQ